MLAEESAKINNLSHNIGQIKDNEIIELIENFYRDMDLPTNDGFNNYLISHVAKKIIQKL